MSDELGTGAGTGQPASGTAPAGTGTTTPAGTGAGDGQPEGTAGGTTGQPAGTGNAAEDTFFDPKELDPALMPAYKNMQRAFGKKMEQFKALQQKVDAYDAFSRDPVSELQRMAGQMGYKLTRAEAAAAIEGNEQGGGEWEPKTWGEVTTRIMQEVMKQINPFIDKSTKQHTIEKLLDDTCPDWREYEDQMVTLLREHPTLSKDPAKLYALAVPPEVLETRATQAALKKLQQKTDAGKVGGTSTTKSTGPAIPDKPLSFNEAVEAAKKALADQGLKAPH